MLVGDCRVGLLMHRCYCTLDRRRVWVKIIERLLSLPAASFLAASCPTASNLQMTFLTDVC